MKSGSEHSSTAQLDERKQNRKDQKYWKRKIGNKWGIGRQKVGRQYHSEESPNYADSLIVMAGCKMPADTMQSTQ